MRRDPRRAFLLTCLSAIFLAALVRPAAAQQPAESTLPRVIERLEGAWTGSGALFGQPADYSMRWSRSDSGFVHLAFSNAFRGSDGRPTPVLSARATFRFTASGGIGVWIDDRPQRITIEAHLTDSSLVSEWSAATERGRTEYRITGPDNVRVIDFVESDGELRQFSSADYVHLR